MKRPIPAHLTLGCVLVIKHSSFPLIWIDILLVFHPFNFHASVDLRLLTMFPLDCGFHFTGFFKHLSVFHQMMDIAYKISPGCFAF